MKLFIAIFCTWLALTAAQEDKDDKQCMELIANLTNGDCSADANLICGDPCGSGETYNLTQCNDVPYCCIVNNQCVMKVAGSGDDDEEDKKTVGINAFVSGLSSALSTPEPPVTGSGDGGGRSGNIYGPGGGTGGGGGYPPFNPYACPKFPQTCQIPTGPAAQLALRPPVDIPYCQRIACSSSNPFLESNYVECYKQPGCYYDSELAVYRNRVGQAVLPGVPVCHRVIRNKAFRAHARATAALIGGFWNPLLTHCVLNEYKKDIFGEHPGCLALNLLDFFGYKGKRAGWRGISERDCALIGACWNKGVCVYPVDAKGQPTVRSSNDKPGVKQLSANLFGQPLCAPFDDSTVDSFLTSYHVCLSIGCAANVNAQTVQDKLFEVGKHLKYPLNVQWIEKVQTGQARPDNYKQVFAQLTNPGPSYGNPQIIPFSHEVGSGSAGNRSALANLLNNAFLQNLGPQHGNGQQESICDKQAVNFPSFPSIQIPSLPIYPPHHRPPPRPRPCPYRPTNLNYPGTPGLSGKFTGCCSKPICYLPKTDLYDPFSGVSNYFSGWSCWSKCSATCGGGTQSRKRRCVGAYCNPQNPGGLTTQGRNCNEHPCPYYQNWGAWSVCSKTCGGGLKTRTRVCVGTGCKGEAEDKRRCRVGACPTYKNNPWGPCSTTCGKGFKSRTRECTHGGAYGCPPDIPDQASCEIFCGALQLSCDQTTCCFASKCVRYDGTPGHCSTPIYPDPSIDTRCWEGACAYNYQAQCYRAGGAGGAGTGGGTGGTGGGGLFPFDLNLGR